MITVFLSIILFMGIPVHSYITDSKAECDSVVAATREKIKEAKSEDHNEVTDCQPVIIKGGKA